MNQQTTTTMTSIKHLLLFVCASVLLFSSCAHDESERGTDSSSALALNLSVEGLDGQAATRVTVDALPGEDDVKSLYLFFFEYTTDGSGYLVDYIDMGDVSASSADLPVTTAGTAVTVADAYTVIGVANAETYLGVNWADNWSGATEANFKTQLIGSMPAANLAADDLPMYGVTTKSMNNGSINLSLKRAVARFDVAVTIEGYTVASARLANVYTAVSLSGEATLDYGKEVARNGGVLGEAVTSTTASLKGLYAFENQVTSPVMGDALTTCLIVGLKDASDAISYHRINIHPAGSAQIIKRNCVYSVTINSLLTTNYSTVNDAYAATENSAIYTINNWDLGDNGLIVSDSYSILAVPVKNIQFGSSGGTYTYTITTFSTLANPSPLTIAGSNNAGGHFTIALSGNLLTVSAPASDEATGSITLTYAGLTATIGLVQSLTIESFLELSYESGFSNLLSANKDATSKAVYVNASGSWTAEIVGDGGLAFNGSSATTLTGSGSDSFTLITTSKNSDEATARKNFVIVSLDSDPINYVGVLSMQQAAAGNITVSPLVTKLVFDGGGTLTSPSGLTNVSASGLPRYNVEVTSATGTISSAILSNDKFEVTSSTLGNASETLTIGVAATNGTTANYTATLTITDSEGSTYQIELAQAPLTINVKTSSPTTVNAVGGETGDVILDINDASASWTASLTAAGVEGTVYHHDVKLVYAATGDEVEEGDVLTATTPIRVKFPKIYFPNREITVKATVTFTTNEGATISHTFTQNKLASAGVHIWSSYYSCWGSISFNSAGAANGSYFQPFSTYLKSHVLNGISSDNSSVTNASSASSANTVAVTGSKTTWAHVSNNGLSRAQTWEKVKSFMDDVDGVTVFMSDDYNVAPLYSLANYSPMANLGYQFISGISASQAAGNYTYPITDTSITATRVYQFIMKYGKQTIPSSFTSLYNDGVNTGVTGYPEYAVPLLKYDNDTYAMVIDPVNKLVYHGDCTNFYYTVNTSNGRQQFMSNYQDYLTYAAMYGSHFTDLLREDGGYASLPAPWDETAWGANAWPARSY